MAMMRGGTSEKGRCLKAGRLPASTAAARSAATGAPSPEHRAPGAHPAERLDLADHLAAEIERGGDLAIRIGLGHIVQRAERQGLEADFGVAPGERGDHQHAQFGPRLQAAAAALRGRPSPASRCRAGRCRERCEPRPRRRACRWHGAPRLRGPGSSSIQRDTRPRTTAELSTIITLMGFAGRVARPGLVAGACMPAP